MDRANPKGADVSAFGAKPKILNYAGVDDTPSEFTKTFVCPGVVCRVHWSKIDGHSFATVELDRSRWREVSAGSDEEREVADHTAKFDCVLCAGAAVIKPPSFWGGFCQSCWRGVGREIYNAGMETGRRKGRP